MRRRRYRRSSLRGRLVRWLLAGACAVTMTGLIGRLVLTIAGVINPIIAGTLILTGLATAAYAPSVMAKIAGRSRTSEVAGTPTPVPGAAPPAAGTAHPGPAITPTGPGWAPTPERAAIAGLLMALATRGTPTSDLAREINEWGHPQAVGEALGVATAIVEGAAPAGTTDAIATNEPVALWWAALATDLRLAMTGQVGEPLLTRLADTVITEATTPLPAPAGRSRWDRWRP